MTHNFGWRKTVHPKAVSHGWRGAQTARMEKKLIRDMDRKVLGGVVAGLGRLYAPQVDLAVLRVVTAVVAVCVPPVIVAYAALWVIAPRSDGRQLQPAA